MAAGAFFTRCRVGLSVHLVRVLAWLRLVLVVGVIVGHLLVWVWLFLAFLFRVIFAAVFWILHFDFLVAVVDFFVLVLFLLKVDDDDLFLKRDLVLFPTALDLVTVLVHSFGRRLLVALSRQENALQTQGLTPDELIGALDRQRIGLYLLRGV